MEGAVVTAATGALGPVVVKLGALLGGEYRLRRRTRKDVKFIRSKLKPVHSILWAIWDKEILDAESKGLKKEALDLADDMHDAIDDFILTLTMESSRRSKRLMVQAKKIKASPFQDFRARVDDVSVRCRNKWKNKSAQPISSLFSSKKNTKPRTPPPPPRAPFVLKNASEVIGMGGWRHELIGYLVGEDEKEEGSTMAQPQLKTASIVGMGGVGKTTLASLVYDDEQIGNKFQSRAFVSVTPTPNMKGVLTSILQQVGAELPAGTKAMTEEDIVHAISNFLENKRYLVIIDDIWHREDLEIISKSFPQNNLGSRIVITTRIDSVPGNDLDNCKLNIRMNPIWSFIRRIWLYGFDKEDIADRMKPDMVGQGFDGHHPIVRMCGGVPSALLCMFSAMAMVLQEQQEQLGVHVNARDVQDMVQKQVKQSGIQKTPGFEPLVESLQLDYVDLPHHMIKTCLLYSSIYPENYCFHMNDLAMRWVAEGFTYEFDAAKEYHEELCNRGLMLRNDVGNYQMNPMMRNFLRWKSREDNFIACSSDITLAYACRIHRLFIDDDLADDGAVEVVDTLLELDWSQIRSLVVFYGANRYVPFEKLERVRVLDLQYHPWRSVWHQDMKDICGGLLRVRHLFVLEGNIREIPPEIARLQHLETLQLRSTWITELPCEIGDLQQLKTLVVSRNAKLAKLPREIRGLRHLETLDLSHNGGLTQLPGEIGNLQNLENLNLHATMLEELPREIWKLRHLKTLEAGETRITRLSSEVGDLQHLETLDLSWNRGLTQLPRGIGKLQNLKRLLLNGTGVVKIPREIGGLKKLEILQLEYTMCELPWEASQVSKLKGVPECVRQAWKKDDLVSCVLAGEMLSIRQGYALTGGGGLIVGRKHMHIPWWIKDHFNDLGYLDIRICKLEEQDLKILREMPNLYDLKLRLEVVPREPIAVSGEGFPSLRGLVVDSRMPPAVTFQEGAMPRLYSLVFEFHFYGGPPAPAPANKGDPQLGLGLPAPANKGDPQLGLELKHLRRLRDVEFRCNEEWYGAAAERSPSMSAMIDVVKKEAQEHPNKIRFRVTGRKRETFPANKSLQRELSMSTSSSSSGISSSSSS